MSRQGLRGLPAFRGPANTLIVYDPWLEMWVVSGWNGGEVLVPERDLAAFLQHCGRFLGGGGSTPRGDSATP